MCLTQFFTDRETSDFLRVAAILGPLNVRWGPYGMRHFRPGPPLELPLYSTPFSIIVTSCTWAGFHSGVSLIVTVSQTDLFFKFYLPVENGYLAFSTSSRYVSEWKASPVHSRQAPSHRFFRQKKYTHIFIWLNTLLEPVPITSDCII